MKSKINRQSLYQSVFSLRLSKIYIAALVLLFGVSAEAFAQTGNYTIINPPGAFASYASAINNAGDVAGHESAPGFVFRGFKWSNGVYTIINPPGAVTSFAYAINTAGDVVGYYRDSANVDRGFKWSNGVYTIINPPGAVRSQAWAINTAGDVVGEYDVLGNISRGFKLSNGIFTTIDFPNADDTYASGINDTGDIIGNYYAPGVNSRGFKFNACRIPGLTALTGTALEWDNLVLMNQPVPIIPKPGGGIIDTARQCLLTATNNSSVTTSWWRPVEYQRHFFQIKDRWFTRGLANCNAPECQTLKTEVSLHKQKHKLGTKVCDPDTASCAHPDGRAFDALETGVTSQILNNCNLYKRYPEDDGVHLELIPTPTINSISPSAARVSNTSLKIKITGNKFYRGSKVYWNGQERPTVFLKETQLQVIIPATDLQNAGAYSITVKNPFFSSLLGNGTSNAKTFTVNQSFLEDNDNSEQISSSQNTQTVSDPRVSVKFKQEVVNGVARYSYRVINNSQRPINNLLIGYDNQNNYTLEYPPVGWDAFTDLPATSYTSPTNWGFDVLWDEGTDLQVLKWDSNQVESSIQPNTSKSGFSIIIPDIDPTYISWFSVTLDDGTMISATLSPDNTSFDFDGDSKTDVSVFRPSTGIWYTSPNPATNYGAIQFGQAGDKPVPADYDGDGKTDVAVYRNGTWYLLRSTAGFGQIQFGIAGDIPQPADFDGDGRAELAVYRAGIWYLLDLSNNQVNTIQFGISTDKPVAADYDGDGKADIAIFRANGGNGGEWWIQRSSNGQVSALQFGTSTDKAVPGDYTGDGKTDIAMFRPSNGNWFILRSEDFSFYSFPFGAGGDIPAPGDYDGDGKTDAAVFRPSNATWYANRSTAGTLIQQFGSAGDLPVPNAFVP